MMLSQIIADTKFEVERRKKILSFERLQAIIVVQSPTYHFRSALENNTGMAVIAEIKRASPSAGAINCEVDIEEQARRYSRGGASAISVVTNKKYFQGDDAFIAQVKKVTNIPILRKDFIIDPYQIYESKLLGADALLFIARLFSPSELKELVTIAHEVGLDCLVETHNEEDIQKTLATGAKIIGINSRDLNTFTIDTERAQRLARLIPDDCVIVAESGIQSRADVEAWKRVGVKAILVGTTLMKATNPEEKIKELSI